MKQKIKRRQQKLTNSLCEILENEILDKISKKDFIDLETQSLILEDLDFMDIYTQKSKIQHHKLINNNYSLLNPQTLGEAEIYHNFKSTLIKINLYSNPSKTINFSIPYSLLQND